MLCVKLDYVRLRERPSRLPAGVRLETIVWDQVIPVWWPDDERRPLMDSHPDRGGDAEAFNAVQLAIVAFKQERGLT